MHFVVLKELYRTGTEGVYKALVTVDEFGTEHDILFVSIAGDRHGIGPEVRKAIEEFLAGGGIVRPYEA